jgi:hypothetical protein
MRYQTAASTVSSRAGPVSWRRGERTGRCGQSRAQAGHAAGDPGSGGAFAVMIVVAQARACGWASGMARRTES